jgi:hypothetical protein
VKCRRCGYLSFEPSDTCRNCGWVYGRYPVLVLQRGPGEAGAGTDRLVREVVARVEASLFGQEETPSGDS